jgi:hypothetical protein
LDCHCPSLCYGVYRSLHPHLSSIAWRYNPGSWVCRTCLYLSVCILLPNGVGSNLLDLHGLNSQRALAVYERVYCSFCSMAMEFVIACAVSNMLTTMGAGGYAWVPMPKTELTEWYDFTENADWTCLFFSCCCLTSFLFIWYFVSDTKGLLTLLANGTKIIDHICVGMSLEKTEDRCYSTSTGEGWNSTTSCTWQHRSQRG